MSMLMTYNFRETLRIEDRPTAYAQIFPRSTAEALDPRQGVEETSHEAESWRRGEVRRVEELPEMRGRGEITSFQCVSAAIRHQSKKADEILIGEG